jgi:hypothetical protein
VGKSRAVQLWLFLLLATSASGCEAVAGIFKAGMWVGIIIVVLIVIAIIAIARAVRRT